MNALHDGLTFEEKEQMRKSDDRYLWDKWEREARERYAVSERRRCCCRCRCHDQQPERQKTWDELEQAAREIR